MKMINIAKEFSRYPAGRFKTDGPYSGELFRESVLIPNVAAGTGVCVDLDGVAGYGSSFLEEAFGGVVRALKIPKEKIHELIQITSTDESLVQEVAMYMNEAAV